MNSKAPLASVPRSALTNRLTQRRRYSWRSWGHLQGDMSLLVQRGCAGIGVGFYSAITYTGTVISFFEIQFLSSNFIINEA